MGSFDGNRCFDHVAGRRKDIRPMTALAMEIAIIGAVIPFGATIIALCLVCQAARSVFANNPTFFNSAAGMMQLDRTRPGPGARLLSLDRQR
jgi:hypothetical protein